MPSWASALDCEPYVKDSLGAMLRLVDYFGRPMDMTIPGAQSHLVEPIDTDTVVPPHYQDQYQVFVDTVGRFGSRPLTSPISVQYSDAYTPYGPFSATDHNGMRFITVRMLPDPGPRLLTDPGALEERKGKGGRHAVWNLPERSAAAPGEIETIEEWEDGAGIHRLTLDPGQVSPGRPLGASQVQINIVIGGTLIEGQRAHPRLTHVLVERGESTPVFEAGDDGADIVVLGFRAPPPGTLGAPAN